MSLSPYLHSALGMRVFDPSIKQTTAERMVMKADLSFLKSEYLLIKQKKSRLSANQRNLIESGVDYLIKIGTIKMNK